MAGSRRRRILFEPLGEERSYSSTSSAVPCSKHRPLFLGLEGRPSIVISGSPSGRRHPSLQQMVRRKTNDLSLGSLKDRSGTMRCFPVRTKLIEHKQPIPLPRRKPAHVSCKTTGRPRTIPTISRRIRAKRISRCRKTPCRGSDCFSKRAPSCPGRRASGKRTARNAAPVDPTIRTTHSCHCVLERRAFDRTLIRGRRYGGPRSCEPHR